MGIKFTYIYADRIILPNQVTIMSQCSLLFVPVIYSSKFAQFFYLILFFFFFLEIRLHCCNNIIGLKKMENKYTVMR